MPEGGHDVPKKRNDVRKVLMVTNAALVGVPAAYAVSNSLPVTVIAAALALGLVLACLR
jgi:hypothetical protein